MRCVNRRSFESKITLPPRSTPEETTILLNETRAGKSLARQKLIEGHMRLVAAIVSRLARTYPHRTNDLLGEGLLILVDCTNRVAFRLAMREHDNFSAYIYKSVYNGLLTFLKKDHTVKIPVNSDWLTLLLQEQGREALIPLFGTVEYSEAELQSTDEHGDTIYHGSKTWGLSSTSKDVTPFLEMLCASDLFTDFEKRIIRARYEGYTDAEIAKKEHVTKMTINNKRHGMTKRVHYVLEGK